MLLKKEDEDRVLRIKESKSVIPCQVRKLPVPTATSGTKLANNGEVFAGAPHHKGGVMKDR